MNDQEQIQADKAAYQEYLRAEAELKQHENEPLSAELKANVQPFTLERLKQYIALTGNTISLDYLVNEIVKQWLYDQGE